MNLTGAKYSIGLVCPCLFSIYRTERWKSWHEFTVQFSILFSTVVSPSAVAPSFLPSTLVATACSNTPVRHPPLFTTSKRRRCFFPLRYSKNFIRSLSNPGTSAGFMKFGDDLKLLRHVREFSECPADDSRFLTKCHSNKETYFNKSAICTLQSFSEIIDNKR